MNSAGKRLKPAVPLLAVLALFVLYSAIRSPVPAVNEPHYLGKAKHFWNPQWCAGDFFLESSNPHAFFYAVLGPLTLVFTLAQTAWIGRLLSLGILALGWNAALGALLERPWKRFTAAGMFVLLISATNFSGEWILGGVEAKVFSYGLVLLAAGYWWSGRLFPAAASTGLAISFHPLVGIWCLLAALGSWSLGRIVQQGQTRTLKCISPPQTLRTAGLLLLLALPGFVPALLLLIGSDSQQAHQADEVIIRWRLGHHMDPRLFPGHAYVYYAAMLIVWIVIRWINKSGEKIAQLDRFVFTSLIFASVGLFFGWGPEFSWFSWNHPLRLKVLKFYPFRLADIALPFLIAIRLTDGGRRLWKDHAKLSLPVVGGLLLVMGLVWTPLPRPSMMTIQEEQHWKSACRWIRLRTEPGALVGMANEDWAVRWWSHHPVYLSFKDCPQDPAGILEWRRRRQTIYRWSQQAQADGELSLADLHRLHALTGIDYLLVSRYEGFLTEPVFRSGPFKIYAIPAGEQ